MNQIVKNRTVRLQEEGGKEKAIRGGAVRIVVVSFVVGIAAANTIGTPDQQDSRNKINQGHGKSHSSAPEIGETAPEAAAAGLAGSPKDLFLKKWEKKQK